MRKQLTEAEAAEGWAAYQRGMQTYIIARALRCTMRALVRRWAQIGYPVRRTWVRPKVLRRIRELAASAKVGEHEVIWAALQLASAETIAQLVKEALADGRLQPYRPTPRQQAAGWKRARYKNRMHETAANAKGANDAGS